MGEILSIGFMGIVGVETFDMLPCIARFTVDGIPVIVREAADTLDGVGLFIDHLDLIRHMMQEGSCGFGTDSGRLTRGHYRR